MSASATRHWWLVLLGVAVVLGGAAFAFAEDGRVEELDEAVVLGEEDLAERMEIWRNLYRRLTPGDEPLVQDVGTWPAAWELFGSGWDNAPAERDMATWVVPVVASRTDTATVLEDSNGAVQWSGSTDFARSESANVTLTAALVDESDWPLYEAARETVASRRAEARQEDTPLRSGLATTNFCLLEPEIMSGGGFRVTVTNGGTNAEAEIFAFTMTADLYAVTNLWTNDENIVTSLVTTVCSNWSPDLIGFSSAWTRVAAHVPLTDGVGTWTDFAISPTSPVRFYAAAIRQDSDGDGLTDGEEIFVSHSDVELIDSDSDGWGDSEEVTAGSNPNSPNEIPGLADGETVSWEAAKEGWTAGHSIGSNGWVRYTVTCTNGCGVWAVFHDNGYEPEDFEFVVITGLAVHANYTTLDNRPKLELLLVPTNETPLVVEIRDASVNTNVTNTIHFGADITASFKSVVVDVDIDGVDDAQEETVGGFVGNRTKLANAPRRRVTVEVTRIIDLPGQVELVWPAAVSIHPSWLTSTACSSFLVPFSLGCMASLFVEGIQTTNTMLALDSPYDECVDWVKLTVFEADTVSLTFTTDHGVLLNEESVFGNNGSTLVPEPEWTQEYAWPISQTRGTTIGIEDRLWLAPSNVTFSLSGIGSVPALCFHAAGITSTATNQVVEMLGEGALPWQVDLVTGNVDWAVEMPDGYRCPLSPTCGICVFVTWDVPCCTGPTICRMDWVCDLAQGCTSLQAIANRIGPDAVAGYRFGPDSIFGINAMYENAWEVLDPDPDAHSNKGDCGTLATLMKNELELLGITSAEVRFVYARHADWAGLSSPSPWTTNYERDQAGNPLEMWLAGGLGGGLNAYEGCCLFLGQWWEGGNGLANSSAYAVLLDMTAPNEDGDGHNHQCWIHNPPTAVSYPTGLPEE